MSRIEYFIWFFVFIHKMLLFGEKSTFKRKFNIICIKATKLLRCIYMCVCVCVCVCVIGELIFSFNNTNSSTSSVPTLLLLLSDGRMFSNPHTNFATKRWYIFFGSYEREGVSQCFTSWQKYMIEPGALDWLFDGLLFCRWMTSFHFYRCNNTTNFNI
jgi:hypothetical protein